MNISKIYATLDLNSIQKMMLHRSEENKNIPGFIEYCIFPTTVSILKQGTLEYNSFWFINTTQSWRPSRVIENSQGSGVLYFILFCQLCFLTILSLFTSQGTKLSLLSCSQTFFLLFITPSKFGKKTTLNLNDALFAMEIFSRLY